MEHILVVDDEDKIRQIIRKYAEYEGYLITEAADGREAVELCRKNDYDLIVMDVMMPVMDGFSACEEIRKQKAIPVIMLSARGEEYDRIHGFEAGVDDYVVKPFSPRELMMRMKVVMGRNGNVKPGDTYKKEGLFVNFISREVFVDEKKAEMTPREYELLFYLVKNRGVALTRERLLSEVWGYDYAGDDRTLDTHIKLLRSSLGEYRRFLVTLRGVGYRFEA
ncbi:MAG: response regulator transcription factor [Lachnospiraceae bacterium]|nr:response regulator transcription factor [Lachnospiraceae bacterium]